MKYYFLIGFFFLVGCTDYPYQYTEIRTDFLCSPEVTEQKANFILECIKNGNPVSDEEPEDWIPICQSMANKTFCELRQYKIVTEQRCSGCLHEEVSKDLISSQGVLINE